VSYTAWTERHGVVERTLGWLLSYRAFALPYDRSATITVLTRLAITLICARHLSMNYATR
jgi:hypothetical protein